MHARNWPMRSVARVGVGVTLLATALVSPAPAVHAVAPAVFPDGATKTATFSQATPVPISAVGTSTVTSTIVVNSVAGVLWDADVSTFIFHSFSGDLDVTISSPAGTVVTLTTDNGGNNDNVFNGTIWDDDANPGGQVPYVNNNGVATDHLYTNLVAAPTLVPEEALGAFIGENPNGVWTLTVSDDTAGDGGLLSSWRVNAQTCRDTTPPTFPTVPDNVTGATAPGASTAVVNYALPIATANIGIPTVACSPASGSAFAVGATTVTCTATNADPTPGTTSFTVTVLRSPVFVPLTPARVLDTRSGAKVGNAAGTGTPLTLALFGKGGLPAGGIGAVALNVTVTNTEDPTVGGGFVTVFPCGTLPEASNLNFTAGQTIPNSVLAPV